MFLQLQAADAVIGEAGAVSQQGEGGDLAASEALLAEREQERDAEWECGDVSELDAGTKHAANTVQLQNK